MPFMLTYYRGRRINPV